MTEGLARLEGPPLHRARRQLLDARVDAGQASLVVGEEEAATSAGCDVFERREIDGGVTLCLGVADPDGVDLHAP